MLSAVLVDTNGFGSAVLDPAAERAEHIAHLDAVELLLAGPGVVMLEKTSLQPASLGPVTGSSGDPITADALRPRWAGFLRPNDIVVNPRRWRWSPSWSRIESSRSSAGTAGSST